MCISSQVVKKEDRIAGLILKTDGGGGWGVEPKPNQKPKEPPTSQKNPKTYS